MVESVLDANICEILTFCVYFTSYLCMVGSLLGIRFSSLNMCL